MPGRPILQRGGDAALVLCEVNELSRIPDVRTAFPRRRKKNRFEPALRAVPHEGFRTERLGIQKRRRIKDQFLCR